MGHISRRTHREMIKNALVTGLGGAVARVYEYGISSFGDESPVVVIMSDGSERYTDGIPTGYGKIHLVVYVFVLYAYVDQSGAVVWSEKDAEDKLDELEAAICDTLSSLTPDVGDVIEKIEFGPSRVDIVKLDNCLYRQERIPLTIHGRVVT